MKPPITKGRSSELPAHHQLIPNEPSNPQRDPLVQLQNGDLQLGQAPSQINEPNAPARSSVLSNLIYFFAGGLLAAVAAFATGSPQAPAIEIHPPPTSAPTITPIPTSTAAPIKVYVTGAVQLPGLYETALNGRVGDVIQLAGGLLPDADPALINQAGLLYDGAQIHVPLPAPTSDGSEPTIPQSRTQLNQPPAGVSGAQTDNGNSLLLNSGNVGSSSSGLVNINNASSAELETLPSVGAARAAEIIAGRPYSTVDDLQKVSGIGDKTMEKLRPLVTVE
ncbi:MAG: ComEA family DNA-binding protein [Chloroflexota bacterium]